MTMNHFLFAICMTALFFVVFMLKEDSAVDDDEIDDIERPGLW